jgi:hypothetical protein
MGPGSQALIPNIGDLPLRELNSKMCQYNYKYAVAGRSPCHGVFHFSAVVTYVKYAKAN